MQNVFVVRNLDSKTKKFIYDYAHEHNLTLAKALKEIVELAKEYIEKKWG